VSVIPISSGRADSPHTVIPIIRAITGQEAGPFTLTYLPTPTRRSTQTIPERTCLVLRNTGRHTVTDVHVRPLLHTSGVATADHLRKHGALGVCGDKDIVAYVTGQKLLVRWVDHRGAERSVWMPIPPMPRPSAIEPRAGHFGAARWGQM
jgi:hypothetical protein